MKRQSKKIYVLPATVLGVTVVAGVLASIPQSMAEDITPIDDDITITVDSACTMGQTTLSTNPTLNPGEINTIGTSRISAYCNDANGYGIYAIGYTNGEYGNTSMQSTPTTGTTYTIPTGLSGEESYWNMSLTPGSFTTTPSYIPTITNNFTSPSTIPNDYTKVATYPSTTIPQSEDPLSSGSYFTTTYTSHISTTQPAGVYTGQVQYVMVHPVGAPAPTFMQDTIAIKNKLTNVGDTMQAIDKRDGKKYWITKLADGNIWMTQNLDHDIVAGKTYTSADTDLPEGTTWTPITSTHSSSDTTWEASNYTPESYDPGNRYWDGIVKSSTLSPIGIDHYHIGNYYNWTAAIATNDSSIYIGSEWLVSQSICPVGWKLASVGNYSDLISAQNLTSGPDGNIHKSPAYFAYSGDYTGSIGSVGGRGHYWSSQYYDNSQAVYLVFNSGGLINIYSHSRRNLGLSVRCIVR